VTGVQTCALPILLGRALFFQGHFQDAAAYLSQAVGSLEKSGNWNDWTATVNHLAGALAMMGQYSAAVATAQREVLRAKETNSPANLAISYAWLGLAYSLGGELLAGLEQSRKVISVAEQTGEMYYVYVGYAHQAYFETLLSRNQEARASFERLHEMAQALGGRVLSDDWWIAIEARMMLQVDRAEEALALAQQAVAYTQLTQSIFAEGWAQRAWGQALAALNPPQWDEAEAHLDASIQLLESGEARLEAARTHVAWGKVCLDRGNIAAAREHFEKAATQYESSEIADELNKVKVMIAALPVSGDE